MSWICDYCSTANEDCDTECFVCGQARSAESIREAKRIAREERTKLINTTIYVNTTKVSMILFFASIILFSVFAIILLFMKMQSGSLDEIIYACVAILENVEENFKGLLEDNVASILDHLVHSPISNVGNTCQTVFSSAINTVQNNGEGIITELFVNKSLKYEAFSRKTVLLIENIGESFDTLAVAISTLVFNIGESVESLISNVESVIQKIYERFSQF